MARLDRVVGARVRRVDVPERHLVALSLARPGGRKEVLVVCPGARPVVGLVDERPRGAPAEGFARTLRRRIGNSVVTAIVEGPSGTSRIGLRRGDALQWLVALPEPQAVLLLGEDGRVHGTSDARPARSEVPAEPLVEGRTPSLEELRAAGPRMLTGRREDAAHRRRVELRRRLERMRKRLERKRRAIEGDRDRAAEAPRLRRDASLLLANLHRIGPRDREIAVTDWEAEPPIERCLQVDARLGAKAQADAMFHRARRLERGAAIATERLAAVCGDLDAVLHLLRRLGEAADDDAIAAVEAEAADRGVAPPTPPEPDRSGSRQTEKGTRLPHRAFVASGDRQVLVGRGASDNDALTLHHARPHDLWLHARGRKGAHVIVPLRRGEACPPELLVDAATLAAHFSEAKGEPVVEVQYTPRRFVRKPKGSAPGAMVLEREKVIAVRIEPQRLERLMAHERR
ncbi:MAG: NFACT RNA binding domain-containing protein [Myxococcota bacterium]